MDSTDWDERYAGGDLIWSAGPNVWVERLCADLTPGSAIDLGAGEGRNALWLAERGWQVTAVDFSDVALERARRLAAERLGEHADRFVTRTADLTTYSPQARYDLALLVYIQLPPPDRAEAVRTAARCVAQGGRLVVVGHHSDNLREGVGGPQEASVLYTEQDVLEDLAEPLSAKEFAVERAERVRRPVPGPGDRAAIDVVVLLRRR